MNNNLIKMQEILMKQIERLDDNNIMKENAQLEISRGNSIALASSTFLKTINIGLRVIESAEKYNMTKDNLSKELGITNEE